MIWMDQQGREQLRMMTTMKRLGGFSVKQGLSEAFRVHVSLKSSQPSDCLCTCTTAQQGENVMMLKGFIYNISLFH